MKSFVSTAAFLFLIFSIVPAHAAEEENLPVPFTSQAPDGNWSEPWQNACEETSIIMVDNFYEGDTPTREEAKKEILSIMKTKEKNFAFSKDESLDLILEVINTAKLGWTGHVVDNPTVDDLTAELDKKRPIIIPVYAPLLHNPFYGADGPEYHVLLLVGFDKEKKEFLVNDPGTKNGKDLSFSYDTLMNAIHDYNPDNLPKGRKAVLFTTPDTTAWSFLNTKQQSGLSPLVEIIIGGLGIVLLGFLWYFFRRRNLHR